MQNAHLLHEICMEILQKKKKILDWDGIVHIFNPNGPELLESLKLWGEGQMAPSL